MILKFINLNSKDKILSYLKISKIQSISQTLPQLLNFHNQILTHKSQTPNSLYQ